MYLLTEYSSKQIHRSQIQRSALLGISVPDPIDMVVQVIKAQQSKCLQVNVTSCQLLIEKIVPHPSL